MLLFIIGRLGGNKSCMAEDKKGVDTANKVSIKALYPKHLSNQLTHNDILIFKNSASRA